MQARILEVTTLSRALCHKLFPIGRHRISLVPQIEIHRKLGPFRAKQALSVALSISTLVRRQMAQWRGEVVAQVREGVAIVAVSSVAHQTKHQSDLWR